MTESIWLTAADPAMMLLFLRGKASGRKLGLIACGCCRNVWSCLPDARSRHAIDVAEAFFDGTTSEQNLESAGREAEVAQSEHHPNEWSRSGGAAAWATSLVHRWLAGGWPCLHSVFDKTMLAAAQRAKAGGGNRKERKRLCRLGCEQERKCQCALLRCIFGNPFRPVTADPAWLTSAVVGLAAAVYEARAFDRLPVLADALEEAGCDHADVLNHCRGNGPHVRGCWVVDLVLGKA